MKKSIKIWLIAAMAAVSGSVWGDVTIPAGRYYFDCTTEIRKDNTYLWEINVFYNANSSGTHMTFTESTGCNESGVKKDNAYRIKDDDNSKPLTYFYVDVTSYTVGNGAFIQSLINTTHSGGWGGWQNYESAGALPGESNKIGKTDDDRDIYLCIMHSNGSYEWSTDNADLPVCAGSDPVLKFRAADAHGTITTHTVNGVSTPSNSAVTSGSSVILVATPAEGYKFRDWTDASSNVVSTNATYAFTITSSVNLTANFEVDNTDPAISGCSGCFRVAP